MKSALALISGAVMLAGLIASGAKPPRPRPLAAAPLSVTEGALRIRDSGGAFTRECPLKHTDVKAEITGFIARATVTQEFENKAFGTEQLPLYVILKPEANGKVTVVGIYDEGKINNEPAFIEFLKSGLK